MYKIATLNKISPAGLSQLGNEYTVTDDLASANGIIVRSADMHDMDFSDCPVDQLGELLARAPGAAFEQWLLDDLRPFIGGASAEKAASEIRAGQGLLRRDALVHGDYCLPNILLDGWRRTGFIDVAEGGVGDRHWDIVWGLWTIHHNLKKTEYGERFLDAYGRDAVDKDRLRICALLAAME